MPLYEYRCSDCDHGFEILQSMGEGAEGLACPRCGETHLEKQFSTFASASAGPAAASAGACGGPSCGSGFT